MSCVDYPGVLTCKARKGIGHRSEACCSCSCWLCEQREACEVTKAVRPMKPASDIGHGLAGSAARPPAALLLPGRRAPPGRLPPPHLPHPPLPQLPLGAPLQRFFHCDARVCVVGYSNFKTLELVGRLRLPKHFCQVHHALGGKQYIIVGDHSIKFEDRFETPPD